MNTVLGPLFSPSDKLFPVTVFHPSLSTPPKAHGPEELSAILSQRLHNPNSSSRYEYLSDTLLNPLQTYLTSLLTQPLRVTIQVKRLGSEKAAQKQQGSIQTWVLPLPTCLPGPPDGLARTKALKLVTLSASHFSQVQSICLFLYLDSGAAEERGRDPNRYRQHPRHFTPTTPQNSSRRQVQLCGS